MEVSATRTPGILSRRNLESTTDILSRHPAGANWVKDIGANIVRGTFEIGFAYDFGAGAVRLE